MRMKLLQPEQLQKVLNQTTTEFQKYQLVYVKMSGGTLWEPAQVIKRCGEGSNNNEILCQGRYVKKHTDTLKECHSPVFMKTDDKPRYRRCSMKAHVAFIQNS